MDTRIADNTLQREVRRRICCRLACHWLLFFGVAVLLTALLEFLFGEPRRPSLALVGEAFQKHSVLFAALLVLIPMSLRDCLRCIDKTVFSRSRTEAAPQFAEATFENLRRESAIDVKRRVETGSQSPPQPDVQSAVPLSV